MQLDEPWTVGVGEDITFSADVSELILFELCRRNLVSKYRLDESLACTCRGM